MTDARRTTVARLRTQAANVDRARREARPWLDGLRAFRHLFRNLYVFNLRADPIDELLCGLRELWSVLDPCLMRFAVALRAMADSLEPSR